MAEGGGRAPTSSPRAGSAFRGLTLAACHRPGEREYSRYGLLAQAAKQAEAGLGQGRPGGEGQRQSRLAAVTADARDQEDRCEPAGPCGGWGLRCDALAGTCSSPWRTGRCGRLKCGRAPSSQLLRSCLSRPPIRLHSPGPHPLATWACSKCGLREAWSQAPPCGEGRASRPPGKRPQVQNKGSRAFLQRLMREPWASQEALLLCTWAGGPGVPAGQAQQFCSSALPQPGGLRAPHPTAGSSWVPRPVLVEGLGISPARATSLQLGFGDTRKTPSPESECFEATWPTKPVTPSRPEGLGPSRHPGHVPRARPMLPAPLSTQSHSQGSALELLALDTRWSRVTLLSGSQGC